MEFTCIKEGDRLNPYSHLRGTSTLVPIYLDMLILDIQDQHSLRKHFERLEKETVF